jgi:hypothetical protein
MKKIALILLMILSSLYSKSQKIEIVSDSVYQFNSNSKSNFERINILSSNPVNRIWKFDLDSGKLFVEDHQKESKVEYLYNLKIDSKNGYEFNSHYGDDIKMILINDNKSIKIIEYVEIGDRLFGVIYNSKIRFIQN